MSSDDVPPVIWDKRRREKRARTANASSIARGKVVPTEDIGELLQAVIRPGDRVLLEASLH